MKMTDEEIKDLAEKFFNENYSSTDVSSFLKPYIINTYVKATQVAQLEHSNATPLPINPEIGVLAKLKIEHHQSGSDLSFSEWLKLPKNEG